MNVWLHSVPLEGWSWWLLAARRWMRRWRLTSSPTLWPSSLLPPAEHKEIKNSIKPVYCTCFEHIYRSFELNYTSCHKDKTGCLFGVIQQRAVQPSCHAADAALNHVPITGLLKPRLSVSTNGKLAGQNTHCCAALCDLLHKPVWLTSCMNQSGVPFISSCSSKYKLRVEKCYNMLHNNKSDVF